MKKTVISAIVGLLLPAGMAFAQQSVNVVKGNVAYSFNTENTGLMNYTDGQTLTILGNEFNLSDVDKITVSNVVVEDNTVLVEYNETSALVSVAGNLTPYVEAEVSGAHVALTQSEDVGDKTCGEITYILKGNSSDGSFILDGSYKATIELQGLTLTNPSGAAIDIENGKRIELSAKNGTVNTYDKAKKGTIKAYDKTKKGARKAYRKTKNGVVNAYDKTKNGVVNAYDKTKNGIESIFK